MEFVTPDAPLAATDDNNIGNGSSSSEYSSSESSAKLHPPDSQQKRPGRSSAVRDQSSIIINFPGRTTSFIETNVTGSNFRWCTTFRMHKYI